MARLSTIIPVYNRQVLAERALQSAIAQDVADHEIIIVDDGSAEPFELSGKLSGQNIRVIRHANNRGAAAARNTGIEAATGIWIAFLDSDDYWLPRTLQPRLEMAEEANKVEPLALVAYAAGFFICDKRTGRLEFRLPRASNNPLHFASGCWFSPGSTFLVRKEVFARIGLYDPYLSRLEDLDWFLRFALKGGRLERWQYSTAMIELGSKPDLAVLERAAQYLHDKYIAHDSPHRLQPSYTRRLKAYLDIERASIHTAKHHWLAACYFMARSFLRMPRTTLHIERFWEAV